MAIPDLRVVATILLATLAAIVSQSTTLRGESPLADWKVNAVPVGRHTASRRAQDGNVSDKQSPLEPVPQTEANDVPRGVSPYANWTDRGMHASVDSAAAREELTVSQMRWINAAYGEQSYRAAEHACAGHARCIRRLATCSDTGHYFGYQVGGGTVLRGTGRDPEEGTFGWDYRGLIYPPRVALGWSHHRYQSGTGAYATDRR